MGTTSKSEYTQLCTEILEAVGGSIRRVHRFAAPFLRSVDHPWAREVAQRYGRARIPGHWPQESADARLHALRGRLIPMKTMPSDTTDTFALNLSTRVRTHV